MVKTWAAIILGLALCVGMVVVIFSRATGWGTYERKIEGTVDEKGCYSNCYTSNPRGYFPVTLQAPTHRVFPDSVIPLKETTLLYCLPYACQARKDGFFRGRPKELFIVGDSFAFGEGNKEIDTLGAIIGEKYPLYNVRNFAETAADLKRVHDIVLDLLKMPKPQRPTKIVYFFNLDDVTMQEDLMKENPNGNEGSNIPAGSNSKTNALAKWLNRFALVRFIENAVVLHQEYNFLTVQHFYDIYFNPANENFRQKTLAYLKDIDRQVSAEGAQMVVVIFPLMVRDVFGHYPFLPIHRFMMDFCRDNHITCLDGYSAFASSRSMDNYTVHPAHAHPNGEANRLLVDDLAKEPVFKHMMEE